MCKNGTATASSLMKAIEPTLVSLLTALNLNTTPDGEAAIAAFNAAQQALSTWTPGATGQVVIESLDAFTQVFGVLPIPPEAKGLESIISAGIVTVIGVIMANSPAPAKQVEEAPVQAHGIMSAPEPATDEETQAMHVAHTVSDTTAKVTELVPGFKRSIFTSPAHQYKKTWNQAAAESEKFAGLQVA